MAWRAYDAECVAGFLLKNLIDCIEAGSGGVQRDIEGTRVDIGVAGAEGMRAAQNIAARDRDVLARMAEREFILSRGARRGRTKPVITQPPNGGIPPCRLFGVSGAGIVLLRDGIGQKRGAQLLLLPLSFR